jgi:copper homeostasis protein
MNFLLEVCAGSLSSAMNAQLGGAGRVELSENLQEGGTTPCPSAIMIAAKHLSIPLFVLIRTRPGDFLYNDLEFQQMRQDVCFCKEYGAEGVVLGILNPDASVDMDRCAELVRLAHPMQVTFHRAFDMTQDPFQAMEDIINLGIQRILTSGQAANALEGAALINELITLAAGRIIIMPGGGINEENILELKNKIKTHEFHASLRSPVKSRMKFRNEKTSVGKDGRDEYTWMETDAEKVKRFINAQCAKQNARS